MHPRPAAPSKASTLIVALVAILAAFAILSTSSAIADTAPTGSSDDCVTDWDHPECAVRCYDDAGDLVECPAWVYGDEPEPTYPPVPAETDETEDLGAAAPAQAVPAEPDYTG